MPLNIIELVTGDDNVIDIQLKRNGKAFAVTSGAVVRAMVIHQQLKTAVGPVTCFPGTAGADWGNGIIVIEFDAASSLAMELGQSILEIEVADGGKVTTFFYRHVHVSEGMIENG